MVRDAEEEAAAQAAAQAEGEQAEGEQAEGGQAEGGQAEAAAPPAAHGASLTWAAHGPAPRVSGWLNVSVAHDFNLLHDHGEALWAAVYYVADGGGGGEDGGDGGGEDGGGGGGEDGGGGGGEDGEDGLFSGSLLLKFQPRPWVHEYTFLPVRPRPGELWLFPGYVPHAVLPRKLGAAERDDDEAAAPGSAGDAGARAPAADGTSALRVSVACNVHPREATPEQGLTEAGHRVMSRLLRRG